jgi:hypothetical protein
MGTEATNADYRDAERGVRECMAHTVLHEHEIEAVATKLGAEANVGACVTLTSREARLAAAGLLALLAHINLEGAKASMAEQEQSDGSE